jgi:hypothetical protein
MRCLPVYHCARFDWKICIHSFSMNFYVFRRTQICCRDLDLWDMHMKHQSDYRPCCILYS